jgi:hypothetical protein
MFAKITNGAVDKFPYSVGELRRDNPNTSFPKQISEAVMADFGMVAVSEKPAPAFDPLTHFAEWGPVPVNEGGHWFLLPTVRELSAEQIADRDAAMAASIRLERDSLLADTDWMALSDVTMSAEMATYRQALRDITAQEGFPHSVNWPAKP